MSYFSGVFGGTARSGDIYTYPSTAETWGGFANEDAGIYPITITDTTKIAFDYTVSQKVELRFRFEKKPFPDAEPAYDVPNIELEEGSGSIEVSLESQGDKTFSSFLLYLITKDVDVELNNIKLIV